MLDVLEFRFTPVVPAGQARVAAELLVASVALAVAGLVSAVATVAPGPADLDSIAAGHGEATEVAAATTGDGQLAPPAANAAAPTAVANAASETTAPIPPAAATAAASASDVRGALPIGKGMWIWLHERAEGGDANAIVAKAKTWGMTHLYVRTATFRDGFMAGPFLDRLLPVAHANGIRVYGWDFPYMSDPGADVNRALAAIHHTTPDGHRIDGFAPDIETKYEGTNESVEAVAAYVTWLRENVGDNYPLIAVVPNPTPGRVARGYPYAQIVAPFDAVAPMVYWMNREPGADVANAVTFLAQFGKPVFPIGQAYDGAIDGGPGGIPNRGALIRFMQVADQLGTASVSFWSWQHANDEAWNAIGDAMEFRLGHGVPEELRPSMIRAYQLELQQLGFTVPVSGQWTPETVAALQAFQRSRGLPESGLVDIATREALLAPIPATIRARGH